MCVVREGVCMSWCVDGRPHPLTPLTSDPKLNAPAACFVDMDVQQHRCRTAALQRPAGVAPIRIQPKLCLASSVDVNQRKEEDEVTVEDLQSESDYAEGTRKSQLLQQHARAVQTTNSTVQRQRPRGAWM